MFYQCENIHILSKLGDVYDDNRVTFVSNGVGQMNVSISVPNQYDIMEIRCNKPNDICNIYCLVHESCANVDHDTNSSNGLNITCDKGFCNIFCDENLGCPNVSSNNNYNGSNIYIYINYHIYQVFDNTSNTYIYPTSAPTQNYQITNTIIFDPMEPTMIPTLSPVIQQGIYCAVNSLLYVKIMKCLISDLLLFLQPPNIKNNCLKNAIHPKSNASIYNFCGNLIIN